ncbi:MAG: type I methionyl aminopeptidase [Salinivirgaceae bacterium]|nr:type I methionyl aminopeptidase [Salinivirgaceae bacterium]
MLFYKTAEEINLIKKSCQLVSQTHAMLSKFIKPGMSTLKLDSLAFDFIKDHHAQPAFLNYNGFPNSLCISVNDTIVHGIPSKYELHEGDIVSIDCGVIKDTFYGDSCYTFNLGANDNVVYDFVNIVKQSLYKGIEAAKEGKRVGDIGFAIQKFISENGFSIVKEMVGHGIGKKLHEEPDVPNYGKPKSGIKLKKGMVLAIEPIVNFGSRQCKLEDDGWTLKTKDGKWSAHFEHTIAIDGNEPEILSDFEIIEQQ